MFKHLIIATDLSARSERAMRRGFALAEAHGAEVTVVSIVDHDLPLETARRMQLDAEREVTSLAGSITEMAFEQVVEIGDPTRDIVRIAEEKGGDLLVLGVHRRRPVMDMLTGTTMERILRRSELPVLLVRDAVDHDYTRVLAGIDPSPACAAALRAASRLAPEAEKQAFHAVHIPYRGLMVEDSAAASGSFLKEAQSTLDAWWSDSSIPGDWSKPEVEANSVVQLLQARIKSFDPHLIVVGAHGRLGVSPLALGSFTQNLIRDPVCDLLVVRR